MISFVSGGNIDATYSLFRCENLSFYEDFCHLTF